MTLYARAGDNNRTLTTVLLLDDEPFDLTSHTSITCRLIDSSTGSLAASTTAVTRATQSGGTLGQIATELDAAELVAGTYALEWVATDGADVFTFPGRDTDRPTLVVRPAAS